MEKKAPQFSDVSLMLAVRISRLTICRDVQKVIMSSHKELTDNKEIFYKYLRNVDISGNHQCKYDQNDVGILRAGLRECCDILHSLIRKPKYVETLNNRISSRKYVSGLVISVTDMTKYTSTSKTKYVVYEGIYSLRFDKEFKLNKDEMTAIDEALAFLFYKHVDNDGNLTRYADESQKFCAICRNQIDSDKHDSHIIAKKHGGSKQIDNICFCCRACNLQESDMNMVFAQYNHLLVHGGLYKTNSALEKKCTRLVDMLYDYYGADIDTKKDVLELYEEMIISREVNDQREQIAEELVKLHSQKESKQTEVTLALIEENSRLVAANEQLQIQLAQLNSTRSGSDQFQSQLQKYRDRLEQYHSDSLKLSGKLRSAEYKVASLTTQLYDVKSRLTSDEKDKQLKSAQLDYNRLAEINQKQSAMIRDLELSNIQSNNRFMRCNLDLSTANLAILELQKPVSICTIIMNKLRKLF
jgi:hypothetical protein